MFSHSALEGENKEVMEINTSEDGEYFSDGEDPDKNAIRLRKSADSEGSSDTSSNENTGVSSSDNGEEGTLSYHELDKPPISESEKKEFRKQLNKEARKSIEGSCHEAVRLIVHRIEAAEKNREEYHSMAAGLLPVIRELIRKTNPLLEHELSVEFAKSQLYGTRFCADKAASPDFRVFARKRPPEEEPSLAVALRISLFRQSKYCTALYELPVQQIFPRNS